MAFLSRCEPASTSAEDASMRLVLSRPQDFADAQHIFGSLHIHAVGLAETLRVAILGEFQYFGGSIGVERHGVDILRLRPGQRRRRIHCADLRFGVMKKFRQRLDLSCERAWVPI